MSNELRKTLALLEQRTNKKFGMRVKRIKETLNIDTSDTLDVYSETHSKTKAIIPKQIDKDGLILAVDDEENSDTYKFSDLNSVEDKISLIELIDEN